MANITVNAKDFTLQPFSVRNVILTPVFSYSVSGANIIVGDRVSQVTTSSGTAYFTGVVSGNYTLDFIGPYKTTSVPLYVTGGDVNAKDVISSSIVVSDSLIAYSRAQSDSRFYPLASNPSGYVRSTQTGVFVTTGQTGNFGGGGSVANVVYTTGSQTISGAKTFATTITTPAIITSAVASNTLIDLSGGVLQDGGGFSTLDWTNRILSGTWNAQALTVQGNPVLTGSTASFVSTTGTQTISGFKTFANAVVTASSLYANAIYGNLGDTLRINPHTFLCLDTNQDGSIDWNSKLLYKDGAQGTIAVDWLNLALSGAWSAQGLTVSGSPVVTANQTGNFVTSAQLGASGYVAATSVLTTLAPTGGSGYRVDFTAPYYQITTNSGISFTSGTNLTGVRSTAVNIVSSNSGRSLSFNANWIFLGTAPTSIASGKNAVLSLTSFGTGQANVMAAWGVQS